MKVLIISHNPAATQNNMGKTFLSLFSGFDRSELCQLYIYPSLPNKELCNAYYRVTDKDVLKSYMGKRNIGGEITCEAIRQDQGLYEDEADRTLYRNRKNKSAFRRLMRDAMWKFAPWYNENLKRWLRRENPDCIFVAPGVAKFLYDIALKISKQLDIPIVTYICDEYYFVKRPGALLDQLRLTLLQKKMEQLMGRTSHLVVISEELKAAYATRFGMETTVLMTGTDQSANKKAQCCNHPMQICYFGNIRCNRFVSLEEIGNELTSINQERKTEYKLKIYTAEKDPQILEPLKKIPAVEMCGFVSGAAYDQAFSGAQLLLHTEAFDEASMDFTKHSVSTKISESLASGIPLVAYGPAALSSMKHLLRYDCAITATSKAELRHMLITAFENPDARKAVTEQAEKTAKCMHNEEQNSRKLWEILNGILDAGDRT